MALHLLDQMHQDQAFFTTDRWSHPPSFVEASQASLVDSVGEFKVFVRRTATKALRNKRVAR